MVLSFSRYKYYEIVQSQDIKTFLQCHINAFEFFGGVPSVIKIDNLKSGVLKVNLYEPTIQKEYADMLYYYNSSPFACRVRYPQEKGKVESGIKYVKNNFFKSVKNKENDYHRIKELLNNWQNSVCNSKIHGTTRKIPYKQFIEIEKDKLNPLPDKRYELYDISRRRVNRYSHITYNYNFYSVPYAYVGETVTIKSNSSLLKIYNNKYEQIALHKISGSVGEFVTNKSHNPKLTHTDYAKETLAIGVNTLAFYKKLKEQKPRHYHRIIQGVVALTKKYENSSVDLACKRALEFNSISYLSVKRICESGLFKQRDTPKGLSACGGFSNELVKYDKLTS